MATVTFFAKPGCIGNRRQMDTLRASGHSVNERDLLSEPWTADRLTVFFAGVPVSGWINRSATRVKNGEIDPDNVNEAQAMALMLADPLLIRRPLMEANGAHMAGWDTARVDAWIGLTAPNDSVGESCARTDDQDCPAPEPESTP